jgi:hypothetical protein
MVESSTPTTMTTTPTAPTTRTAPARLRRAIVDGLERLGMRPSYTTGR